MIEEAPPKPKRSILKNEKGEVRAGLVLLARAAGWFAVTMAVRLGLSALLRGLFQAWNINVQTVARAPGWARALYVWQGSLITLFVDIAAILFAVLVCKVKLRRPDKALGGWWAVGTGLAVLSAALFLLTDSLRLYWPLGKPRLTLSLLPLWALTLLTAVAEELFTKGVVYGFVKRRWGMPWAVCATILLFFLTNGGYAGTWLSGVNVALIGALCALLYDRCGLWAPVGFRWGWGFATAFLLGEGGGDQVVYRLYSVSEPLLTGGDAGLVYGAWTTGALLVMILFCLKAFGSSFKAIGKRQ